MPDLRSLPSVDQLLQTPPVLDLVRDYGRPLTIQAIRNVLDDIRHDFTEDPSIPDEIRLVNRIQQSLENWTAPTLRQVFNASGVILHTNLGRAPLSRAALAAIQEISLGYSTLEYDVVKGQRGARSLHAEELLKRLTGADAALVVNNNAAAVLLVLTAFAKRRAVAIARSQLVEIGGGFRIPDVMKQSGARLVEVGTTNRVHRYDFEQAVTDQSLALIMRAHRSNFQIIGFTSEPTLAEMGEVASLAGIPLVDDLGSGSLLDTARFGLAHEPMVQESLAAGADLVCFSGDKLLGGPQAGIIIGKEHLITRLKKHPLARALRADKLCLAALSATLLHYLKDEAIQEIPVWRMIATPAEAVRMRAEAWRDQLHQGEVIAGQSTVGGGSLPEETLPTFLLALSVRNLERSLARLRQVSPPIIARLQNDRLVLDPRTVLPEQDEVMLGGLQTIYPQIT